MKIIDLNLLLYAINSTSPKHREAKTWCDRVLSGDEPIGMPWIVVIGFLRISTNERIFSKPLTPEQALTIVDDWLALPAVHALSPGDGHWSVLRDLVSEVGTAGSLTTDAHLAALAIENGAELCSTDADFGRFPRLRWTNPLAS